jgi:hypothetical protein
MIPLKLRVRTEFKLLILLIHLHADYHHPRCAAIDHSLSPESPEVDGRVHMEVIAAEDFPQNGFSSEDIRRGIRRLYRNDDDAAEACWANIIKTIESLTNAQM